MIPPLTIRQATADDEAAVRDCLQTAFAPYRHFYSPEGFADTTLTPDTYRGRLRHSAILVGELGGRVVATIACSRLSPEEGHLRGMAVLPAFHGQGIAGRMLAAAEALIREWGCREVSLDTTQPLQRAIRFYETHDYVRTDKVADFYGMPLLEFKKTLR